MYFIRHTRTLPYSELCILSEIQIYLALFTSYSDIFSHIVAYLKPSVSPVYSKPCHVQNPYIFRTRDIFRTLSRNIPAYSEGCVTLAYWKPSHIQKFVIFRILAYSGLEAYSESCLYRYIQTYSGIFKNEAIITLTFFFYTLILDILFNEI